MTKPKSFQIENGHIWFDEDCKTWVATLWIKCNVRSGAFIGPARFLGDGKGKAAHVAASRAISTALSKAGRVSDGRTHDAMPA